MEGHRERIDIPQWTLSNPKDVLRCTDTSQKLESAIFNAVSLGQWEIARAHFVSFARGRVGVGSDAVCRENARELLKLLAMEASNFWSGSVATPTPHHLSWLALQTYHSLYTSPEEQLPEYVGRLIEFRLLLCSVLSDSSSSAMSVSSTLCRYHATHVLAIPGAISESASPFQSAVLSFLHNVLVSKPATGHALIQSLTAPDRHTNLVNNEALQLLYVEAIYESLEAILQLRLPEAIETDSDSQYESDHTWTTTNQGQQNVTKECQRLTNLVYDLLSLMDPKPDMARVAVDKLFVYLLELDHTLVPDRSIRFEPSKIYACLLGRSSPYLLKRLQEVEEYMRTGGVNRSADEKTSGWSLKLLREMSTSLDWRGLFYHAYHDRKHFLECVLEIGLQLIRVGRLEEVAQLLSKPEYVPLRPALLLLGWDVYVAEGSGKELTEAIWPSQVLLSQPMLYEGCCRLAFQVELVQWCLDKARPHLLPSSSSPSSRPSPSTSSHHRAGDMFKGLETHSVLHILHHYTPLAGLDPLEVVEILKHRPRVPSLSMSITPPPQFSRGPTPLKPPHKTVAPSPATSALQTQQQKQPHRAKLKPEQERDIAIFRSFHALKLVLDALWAAVQINSGIYPTLPDKERRSEKEEDEAEEEEEEEKGVNVIQSGAKPRTPAVRKLDFGKGEDVTKGEISGGVKAEDYIDQGLPGLNTSLRDQIYSKLVLDKLQEAKTYISLLYPLNYRLEILENIFSLLFLTNEDIVLHQQEESGEGTFNHGSNHSSNMEGLAHQLPSFQSDGEYSAALSSVTLLRSKHGFLVNEKVTGDLLSVLQDSMRELSAARYALSQPTMTETTPTLQPGDIKSSVSASLAQQRSAKLEQYINEARWRLQLVSSQRGTQSDKNHSVGSLRAIEFSSSGDSGSEVSESDTEPEEKPTEGKRRQKKLRRISTDPRESKSPVTQPTPEYEMTSVISNRPPPTIMSRLTYSEKIAVSVPVESSSRASPSKFSNSQTFPSLSSHQLSPSPKLGKRHNVRQRSPRVSVEGHNERKDPRHSPRPSSSSSLRTSDPPQPLLCELDSGDCADVEEKSPQHRKRKRRLQNRSLQAAKKRRLKISERTGALGGAVGQMLASPTSLLRMCLKHSNYSRAYEVLRMFEMEGQFGEAFVLFSEKFESVSRELAQQSCSTTPKHSPSLTPQEPSRLSRRSPVPTSSSSLHPNAHLHIAIANATNSTSVLESLHHLLAPTSLHRMLLSGDSHLERATHDSTALQILTEHVPTLVMLDIVCSSRVSGQMVKRIVEEASSQCQPVLESLTVKSHSGVRRSTKTSAHQDMSLPGPFSLLLLLSEVSGYFTGSLPALHVRPHPPPSPPYHSPHALLSFFPRQLKTASIVSYKSFQDLYHNARDRLSKLLEQDTAGVKGDIIAALTQSDLPLEEPHRSLSHALHQRNILNSLFGELTQVLAGNAQTVALPGSPKDRGLMRRTSSSVAVLNPDETSLEGGGVNTNFVLQFSHYLSQLVDLLLKCLSPAPTALSEASLLLSILQESPSQLLGRLVFEVGVAPQRLEVLMASFHHIHMMEVLVRCCCPQLPAGTSTAVTPVHALPPPVGVVALNEGRCERDDPPAPTDLCVFSEKLLTNLLSLLREYKTPAEGQDGFVSSDDLLAVYNSSKMKSLIARTFHLGSVDLGTLVNPAEQIAFYSNVVNFLYVHCIMMCIAGEYGEATSVLQWSKLSLAGVQRSPVLQAGVFSRLGYHVGQLGLVSCHDLHHCILRRGLSSAHVGRDTPLLCRLAPLKPDPWAQYAPTSPDPRVLYVVHTGPASSPLPVPIHPDDLLSSLKAAERRYLNHKIHIDVAAKEVTIPQRLYTHRDDFGKPVWNDRYSNSSLQYMADLSLLNYVQSHIGQEQGELLQPLVVACEAAMTRRLPLPVKISARREEREFGYHFTAVSLSEGYHHVGSGDGSRSTETSGQKSPSIGSPKVLRKRLSRRCVGSQMDILESAEAQMPQTVKEYTFTPEILTFVTHQNPLLAALIHLLCPPPPSPPSLTTPPRKGTSKGTTSEEEGTTGIGTTGGGSVSEGEESSWKTSMFGLRGRGRSQLPRRLSYDQLIPLSPTTSSWQRELDDILIQFVTLEPMQQFLRARLCGFNSVLSWDLPRTGTTGDKRGNPTRESCLLEPREPLRCLALLPSRGNMLGTACSYALHFLIETGRVQDAVWFLASEPVACNRSRMNLLSDIAVSSAFVATYSEILSLGHSGNETARDTLTPAPSPLSLVFRLSDPEMAAHLVLSSLHNWPVDTCRDLLSLCSHHLSPSSLLLPTVQSKLERITVYTSIMDTCRSLLFSRSSDREKRKEQKSWTRWTDLASDSESRPQYVLDVLLTEKAFDLARKWAQIHSLPQSIAQQIEVDYVSALLEGTSPDPMSAHRVLDSLVGDRLRLRVCESVLEQRIHDVSVGEGNSVETVIFILHYILSKLNDSLGKTKRVKYINWLLGAKALLCLPQAERSEYRSLIGDAALLVEQLLINKKTELVAVVVKELRRDQHIDTLAISDMPKQDHTPVSLPRDDSEDPFTPLLVFYAGKTLEFPEPVITSSTSQSYSISTTAQSTRPASPKRATHPPTVPLSPLHTDPPSRMSYTHRRKRSSQPPVSPTPLYPTDSAHHYEPPVVPPPKDQWERDSTATHCQVCHDVYFGMFNRRHHCRRCGRVVCARCSPFLSHVEGYGERLQRVCKNCHSYQQLFNYEDGSYSSDQLAHIYPALSPSLLQRWKLIPNDNAYNNNIRSEFYYEESPSSDLCLTLVDLIASRRLAAAFLLDHCHSVSLQLVPDTHGRVNQEVDHYFVIGLIQNLLWNAKLRFEEATDSSGVEICDTYLSRVDLLRQLVSSHSRIIPSIQELTKSELARRVRDRLIQEDQYELAMEVSTKCQLDTSLVWSSWGIACLRCGELVKARDKFKHCFQMSSQRGGSGVAAGMWGSNVGVANVQLLERIVDQLEQNPLSVTICNSQQPTDDWSSVMVSCLSLTEKHSEDCDLDTHRFEECLHYIESYGSHSAAVTFFVRHNCWTDACKYILDEKCSVEVFVEEVWVPALKAGVIDTVQDILKALNHSLGLWEPYLTAVCRFLSQRSLYHILYQTQLYMRDFIRAAMTCIKFFIGFTGRSTTIRDLYSRLHYLRTAQQHFQSALESKQRAHERSAAGGRGRGYLRSMEEHRMLATSTKNMSVPDLHSHINTIALQMKVTEFLYRCAEVSGTLRTPLTTSNEGGGANTAGGGARKSSHPITLFSSGHTRAEVAVQLMLKSHDILEGFDLAQEVMTAYRLPPSNILSETSQGLAAARRYNDVRVLLDCLSKSSFASNTLHDEILMAAIREIASHTKEIKQVEKLVHLLTNERSKIKALVQCGKLKNAYLIAIKSRHVHEVRNIAQIAEKAGQIAVRDICNKWLQANAGPL